MVSEMGIKKQASLFSLLILFSSFAMGEEWKPQKLEYDFRAGSLARSALNYALTTVYLSRTTGAKGDRMEKEILIHRKLLVLHYLILYPEDRDDVSILACQCANLQIQQRDFRNGKCISTSLDESSLRLQKSLAQSERVMFFVPVTNRGAFDEEKEVRVYYDPAYSEEGSSLEYISDIPLSGCLVQFPDRVLSLGETWEVADQPSGICKLEGIEEHKGYKCAKISCHRDGEIKPASCPTFIQEDTVLYFAPEVVNPVFGPGEFKGIPVEFVTETKMWMKDEQGKIVSEEKAVQKVSLVEVLTYRPLDFNLPKMFGESIPVSEHFSDVSVSKVNDPDVDTRVMALVMLGEFGKGEDLVSIYTKGLKDENEGVRDVCAFKLEELADEGNKEAIGGLVEALGCPDEHIRIMAVGTLQNVTGRDFGRDQEKWREWWQQEQKQPGKVWYILLTVGCLIALLSGVFFVRRKNKKGNASKG